MIIWGFGGSANNSVVVEEDVEETPVPIKPPTTVEDAPTEQSIVFCETENSRGYELCIEVIPEAPTSFRNCDLMREWYPRGVPIGHPTYAIARDGDNDGWACE